jgi:hypothetical protein
MTGKTPAPQPDPEWRPVVYDLMAGEDYFVLTEALAEWGARQRAEAEHDPDGAASRIAWADAADRMHARAEAALGRPGGDCSGFVVADRGPEDSWPDLGMAPLVLGDLTTAVDARDALRERQTAYGKSDRYFIVGLIELED